MTIAAPVVGLRAAVEEELPAGLTQVVRCAADQLCELSDSSVRSAQAGGHRELFKPLQSALGEAAGLVEAAGFLDACLGLRWVQTLQGFGRLDCDGAFVSHRSLDAAFCYLGCAERFSEALALDIVDDEQLADQAIERQNRRLRRSLRLRREFADFRLSLARSLDRPDVEQRLRYTASALATLLGRERELFLRDADAYVLRSLQDRIRRAMAIAPTEIDSGEAQRLLSDVANAGAILVQINHREELCIHDRELAASLPSCLPAEQTQSFKTDVSALYGLVIAADADLSSRADLSPSIYDVLLAAARR